MEVRLRVTHCNGLSRPREVPLTMSEAGIDIGRALISDLCLEDPERVVSGLHARIHTHEGRIWLTDLSRNGTYLNDAPDPISAHHPVELHDGDRLGVGPYEVLVSLGASLVSSLAKPRQIREESKTEALAQFDPSPGPVEESATAVWSLPELPATDTGAPDDPFAATAVIDATQAGVMPTGVASATTLIQGPPADEIRPSIPGLPSLDEGPTEVMPALTGTDERVMDTDVQAALHRLLERFEPAVLERRFVGVPATDRGLSMEDKARCWEGFRAIYAQLATEAMTDFMPGFDDVIRSR